MFSRIYKNITKFCHKIYYRNYTQEVQIEHVDEDEVLMHGESVLAFDHHETVDNKYNDETGDEYNTTVSYDDVNQAASTILSISEEEDVIVILLVIKRDIEC